MKSRLETEKLRWETSFRDWKHFIPDFEQSYFPMFLWHHMSILLFIPDFNKVEMLFIPDFDSK